jgi:hypothetical protein
VSQSIYYAKNIASAPAGVNKVTVAFSNSAAFPDIRILEYSGIDTTLPVDATAVGTGSNATSSSGALTTTNPVDLLVAGNIVSSLTSAGDTNFTTRIITNPNGDIAEDRVVGAAGNYTATATLNNSGGWVMQMIAFRAAGGSTPPTDTTPPTVSITSPSQGGSVNGSVIVTANADDANGVAGVQFKADGVNVGAEDTVAPYSVAWDTSALVPGSVHTLTAVARDNAGNSAVSTAISVTVQSSATLSTIGQWQGPVNMPLVAVHVTLMPNGKILVADGQEFGPSAQVWDPVNNAFTAVTAPANIFCAGHTVMADGRVFVNGGHISSHVGLKSTLIFNYQSNTWFTGPSMSNGRWYPTATVLPDGRIITISGESTCDGCYVPQHEIYDPSNNTWSILTGADFSFAFYPHVFILPTGKLLVASTTEAPIISRVLDLNTKVWTPIGSTAFDGGSAIMYRPGKILKTGTSVNPDAALRQAFPTAYVLDMNQPSPAWRQVSSMSFSRTFHSTVMLPDGNVLVVGGGNTTDAVNPAGAIYQAEIWSPSTETFTPVASMTVPRLYHSNALLLPDGRVVMTGGGRFNDGTAPTDRLNAEYYLPPYMFKGARPTITSAPSSVQYATNFTIQTPDAAQIASVVMIRLGSSTHSFNMSQNYVPLTFSAIAGGLSVQGPSDSNLASPGYYMLFIVNTNGVPSVAPIVNLPLGTVATQPPAAPANLVASGGIGTVSLSWSASVSATGYSVYRSTTSGFTPSSATLIGQPSGTTFVDTSFVSSGTYFYLVTARNGAPGESAPSNQAVIDVSVDTGAPTPPSNLTATSTSNSQIALAWTAATDDVGVTGYRVERCQGATCTIFAQIATPTAVSFGDSGLAASTAYRYRVRATDAVGNLSPYSNIASATTAAAPPPPTTPTFIQQNSATPQSASTTTLTVTYTAAQRVGDLNVVVVGWNNTTAAVGAVTDTAGNLYTRAIGPTIGSNEGQSIYYAKNIVASAAGVNKVTVTFSPAAAFPDVRILEYSGIDSVTPIDVTGGAVGNSATSSSGTITTTNATDLLFAANTVATTTNGPGTGFTSRVITTPDSDIAEDKVVTVTGNYSATAPISSGAWVMQIVAFRGAGSMAPAVRSLEGGHAIQ